MYFTGVQVNMNNILIKNAVFQENYGVSVIFYNKNRCFFMICQLTVDQFFGKLLSQTKQPRSLERRNKK